MNALDQAFIKAFAKDQAAVLGTERKALRRRARPTPPAEEVESVFLIMHELYQPGRRLRVDRPGADRSVVEPHMVFPSVECVDSYDPCDVSHATQESVVFEDRLTPLDPCTATVDRSRAASEPNAKPQHESDQGQAFSQCQPKTLLVAPNLDAPELMTEDFGQLDPATMFPVDAATSAIEILLPELDLDALAAGVMPPRTNDRDASDAAVPDTRPAEHEAEQDQIATDASPLSNRESFAPAWEVDAFRWPELCQQLDEQTRGRLAQSGDELSVAAQDGLKVLAVTSWQRAEGRTSVAVSLARAAALAGSRVALLDADAANPELARRLGMEAPCDWREVVGRGEPLSEAAVASLEDRVTLLPRTLPTNEDGDSIDQFMLSTLSELRRHFDLIVVDLPPVGPGAATSEYRSRTLSCGYGRRGSERANDARGAGINDRHGATEAGSASRGRRRELHATGRGRMMPSPGTDRTSN